MLTQEASIGLRDLKNIKLGFGVLCKETKRAASRVPKFSDNNFNVPVEKYCTVRITS